MVLLISLCRTKSRTVHVCELRSRAYSSDVRTLLTGFSDVPSAIDLSDDLMSRVPIKPGETSSAVSTARLEKKNSSMSLK